MRALLSNRSPILVTGFRLIVRFEMGLARSLWTAGRFVWMKLARVFVPGEASSQAADPGGDLDEVILEV